jgi:hypothetical protein
MVLIIIISYFKLVGSTGSSQIIHSIAILKDEIISDLSFDYYILKDEIIISDLSFDYYILKDETISDLSFDYYILKDEIIFSDLSFDYYILKDLLKVNFISRLYLSAKNLLMVFI